MSDDPRGHYWVTYKDFNTPVIIEIRFQNFTSREGGDWQLWEDGEMIPPEEYFKYSFISKVPEPEFPHERIDNPLTRRE